MADRLRFLSEFGELVLDAFVEIRSHRLRSLLTLSGIVFGAASLVSMTSVALALKQMAYRDLESMGFPHSYTVNDRGPRSDAKSARDLQHPALWIADADALRSLPGVATVLPRGYGWGCLTIGPAGRREVQIDPIDAGYTEARSFRLTSGRTLRPLDIANASRVAVIGRDLVQDLFAGASPLGRTITIGGVRFLVIGVVAPQQYEIIPEEDSWVSRRIYVPYTWLPCLSQGPRRVASILVTTTDAADLGSVLRAGQVMLRQRHRGVEDFAIDNEAARILRSFALADSVLGGWDIVMYAISAVTLLVGGIGLFSVLLISVRERVKEIGIRKALGADDGDIMRLFLVESLTLSVLGAVVGIGGGAGLIAATEAIARQFGREFTIALHLPGAAMAIGFSLIVGVVFGWYPARRAARLDPIVAMSGV